MPARTKAKPRAARQAATTTAANGCAQRLPRTLRFYGDEFVFDTVSGMFYVISRTAGFIFRALDAGTQPDKLADEVQQRYGITRSAAVRDIEHLMGNLSGGAEPQGMVRA
jgi:hypothetical protein